MLPWKPVEKPARNLYATRAASASRQWFRAAIGAVIAAGCWQGIDSPTTHCHAETPAVSSSSSEADPLDALRKRSAGDRWQRIKAHQSRPFTEKAVEPETNSALPAFEPTPQPQIVENTPPKALETRDTKVELKTDDGFQSGFRANWRNDNDQLAPLTIPRKKIPIVEPVSSPAPVPAPVRSQRPKAVPREEIDAISTNDGWIVAAPHTVIRNRAEADSNGKSWERVTPVSGTNTGNEDQLSVPAASPPLANEEVVPPPAPIVAQSVAQNTGLSRPGSVLASQGNITIRGLSEIRPIYDVEKDQRIREYALEKMKEYKIVLSKDPYPPRAFSPVLANWDASDLYHYPLYFEDEDLERYGHTYGDCIQPFVSIGKFTGQFLLLPYQMTIDPICMPKYTLGYYRPGECAPYLHKPVPWNLKAAAVEAGVVTGLIFLIP